MSSTFLSRCMFTFHGDLKTTLNSSFHRLACFFQQTQSSLLACERNRQPPCANAHRVSFTIRGTLVSPLSELLKRMAPVALGRKPCKHWRLRVPHCCVVTGCDLICRLEEQVAFITRKARHTGHSDWFLASGVCSKKGQKPTFHLCSKSGVALWRWSPLARHPLTSTSPKCCFFSVTRAKRNP